MPASVSKSGPGLAKLEAALERIKRSDVLVGIPANKATRPGDPINNASLLYIQSKGSPLKHIPARPVLEPAIEANRDLITPELAASAKSVLEDDPKHAEQHLAKAGVIAANAAKRWFTNPANSWPENAPSTIAAKGSDKPLLDTARMRGAITSVVRTERD